MDARRILVYGVTGSGKTTLARRLARATGLPLHEVDELTWEPGWREVPLDVQRARIAEIVAGPEWVLDSAYGKWLDLVLPRTELVVGLDYPRWLSLGRLLRRTAVRAMTGELACNRNRESLRLALSRESIVRWHFKSFASKRGRLASWSESPGPPEVLRFRWPRAAEAWLAGLRGN